MSGDYGVALCFEAVLRLEPYRPSSTSESAYSSNQHGIGNGNGSRAHTRWRAGSRRGTRHRRSRSRPPRTSVLCLPSSLSTVQKHGMAGLDASKNLPPSGCAERVVGVTGPPRGVVDDDARTAQSRASKPGMDRDTSPAPNCLGPPALPGLVDICGCTAHTRFQGLPFQIAAACAAVDPCHPPACF